MDKIGTVVGRYNITGFIGSGAMADVYETYDPEINRSAALKLLKEDKLIDKEYLSRFLTEAKAAGALTHPNIVTVYDVGKIDETPYIMMELLEGITLSNLLQNNDRLPIKTLLNISMQIASALDYAHNMGIVHRDIKPDNIIYHEQHGTVKIADFGIAHLEDSGEQEQTLAGTILGTPRYMSPEQAKGEPIDGRSDLFSLGVILYELLTGHKAFSADSIPTLILQIIQKDPTPIRQYYPEAPAGLQSIIGKLLHKKPAKRFQTGAELYDALEKELRVLRDDEDASSYLPMQIKWTAAIGAIVAVIMVVSVLVVFKVQSRVLSEQVVDSGVSLARFIAAEIAVPVLGEDWIGLETLTDEASKRQSFSYLTVIDHDNIVRSATDKTLLNQPWVSLGGEKMATSNAEISVATATMNNNQKIFTFTAPIRFNAIDIGKIDVGISQARLEEVQSVTKRIMTSLALTIILAMLVIIFFFNKLIAKNLKVIQRSMQDFTDGNHSIRISRPWKSEFGGVASAFNIMADSIHHGINPDSSAHDSNTHDSNDPHQSEEDMQTDPQESAGADSEPKSNSEPRHQASIDHTIIDTGIDDLD
ncbi:MAG: protein kinase [Porticoccaceae bacterium]